MVRCVISSFKCSALLVELSCLWCWRGGDDLIGGDLLDLAIRDQDAAELKLKIDIVKMRTLLKPDPSAPPKQLRGPEQRTP